eukprot:4660996-Pleurochrysis_carterae.AAC.1
MPGFDALISMATARLACARFGDNGELVAARSGTSSGHSLIGWCMFRVVPSIFVHLRASGRT